MFYSLKQAAEAIGKSKPTVLRAIQTGKISAKKNDLGEWEIDPAELHRVYLRIEALHERSSPGKGTLTTTKSLDEIRFLQQEVARRDEQLATLRDERQREQSMMQKIIDDLNRRLDDSTNDLRQAQGKLTALLTDNRPTSPLGLLRWFRR